jgi:hypothetical protein
MGSKPVAYFAFPTCLNAMQICCLIHIFIRFTLNFKFSTNLHGMQTYWKYHVFCRFACESKLLQILYLHWVDTQGKPNLLQILYLHYAKLLQMSYLPKVCNRFALYGFTVDCKPIENKRCDRFVLSAKLIRKNKHTLKQLFYPHGTLYYTQTFNYVNN